MYIGLPNHVQIPVGILVRRFVLKSERFVGRRVIVITRLVLNVVDAVHAFLVVRWRCAEVRFTVIDHLPEERRISVSAGGIIVAHVAAVPVDVAVAFLALIAEVRLILILDSVAVSDVMPRTTAV